VTTAPTYAETSAAPRRSVQTATVGVLIALSASHMLNDVMQSLAPALYPVFHQRFALSFFQIGLITFVFQLTASFLQPLIGMSLAIISWLIFQAGILAVGSGFPAAGATTATAANGTARFHEPTANGTSVLAPGESPPYDSEAT